MTQQQWFSLIAKLTAALSASSTVIRLHCIWYWFHMTQPMCMSSNSCFTWAALSNTIQSKENFCGYVLKPFKPAAFPKDIVQTWKSSYPTTRSSSWGTQACSLKVLRSSKLVFPGRTASVSVVIPVYWLLSSKGHIRRGVNEASGEHGHVWEFFSLYCHSVWTEQRTAAHVPTELFADYRKDCSSEKNCLLNVWCWVSNIYAKGTWLRTDVTCLRLDLLLLQTLAVDRNATVAVQLLSLRWWRLVLDGRAVVSTLLVLLTAVPSGKNK